MISSHPDDSLKPSRRNLHECNRCFLASQAIRGFSTTNPTVCLTHCFSHHKRCERVASHARPELSPGEAYWVRLHYRTTSPNSESRPLSVAGHSRARNGGTAACVEMSICLQLMMIISSKLWGPHHKSRLRARRAAPTACRIPVAAAVASRDITASCLPPTIALLRVCWGHVVSRSWDEVWTTSAIGAGALAAPTPPRTKLPTTAHHARHGEGSHHSTLVLWTSH